MKATLESTSKIVSVNGVPARIWEGKTEKGTRFMAFITRVAVPEGLDQAEFTTELKETAVPSADAESIPLRFIL